MTQEKIIEGNKLIDSFMGIKRVDSFGKKNNDFSWFQVIKYHSSWDWLMAVVQKIAYIVLNREWKNLQAVLKRWNPIIRELQNLNIESLWLAVIDFINWYNLHNPSTPPPMENKTAITARELRIGNWLLFSNKIKPDEYVQVTPWFFRSFSIEIDSDLEVSGYYNPIPLTPEILEKAGFVKWNNANFYEFPTPNGIIHLDMNDTELFIGGNDSCTSGMGYIFSIKYVHQLQNLIHALTGKELPLTL